MGCVPYGQCDGARAAFAVCCVGFLRLPDGVSMHVLSYRLRDHHGPSDVARALLAFFGGSLVSSGICRVGLCVALNH